jgi:hypothetical protein
MASKSGAAGAGVGSTAKRTEEVMDMAARIGSLWFIKFVVW